MYLSSVFRPFRFYRLTIAEVEQLYDEMDKAIRWSRAAERYKVVIKKDLPLTIKAQVFRKWDSGYLASIDYTTISFNVSPLQGLD